MAEVYNVGGQAVIEGVMMRGKDKIAVAVRDPQGNIVVDVKDSVPMSKKNKFYSLPFIRGAVALIESLYIGVKILTYSASFFEEVEETKFEKFLTKKLGDKKDAVITGLTVAMSVFFAALLFFILPTFAASFLRKNLKGNFLPNLFEGIIRIVIFLIYLLLISRMEDIRRVFEYHGAEHKSIYCYEAKLPLKAENAVKFSTLHPRCGTNFLFIVMIVSIFLFSFFGWPNVIMRIILRIVLLPLVAGISYEVIRWLGKSEGKFANIVAYPGLMLQRLTTREPDLSQLEVAMAALKAAIGYVDEEPEDEQSEDEKPEGEQSEDEKHEDKMSNEGQRLNSEEETNS